MYMSYQNQQSFCLNTKKALELFFGYVFVSALLNSSFPSKEKKASK